MNKINWNFVDKIVFINLEKRQDRLAEITDELKVLSAPADKIVHFKAIEEKEGAIGCAKSHLCVLNMAEKNNWKNVLILEDDMVFQRDEASIKRFNLFLDELTQINWDVGFLSASYFTIKKVKEVIYKVELAYLANSYLVNQHYYKKLMGNFSEAIERMENGESRHRAGLDSNWMKLMKKDSWYGVYPCVGHQSPGMSDIENVNMDRREYFKRAVG